MARLVILRKGPNGMLTPASETDAEDLRKYAVGAYLRCEIKEQHNYKFLKKLHCLARLAYDHWCEHGVTSVEYRGQKVQPNYERFRKDLTILAGHYTATYNIRGEVRMEAESWSYAKANDQAREKIYSDLINAALKNIYKFAVSEEELRALVEQVLHFDG